MIRVPVPSTGNTAPRRGLASCCWWPLDGVLVLPVIAASEEVVMT